jgi:hypothetical protein
VTRVAHAWRAMHPEQRLAALAALALLVTMFFPWYGLQSLDRKTGVIHSHDISAFGDVSFVEAAIFLVAVGVTAMLLARAEGRDFHLPGGDGTVVLIAGAWAGLLIFFRVFSRPAGDGYPVGIEWGFFLAFVAAGSLAFAGLRMRASERPGPPLVRPRGESRRRPVPHPIDPDGSVIDHDSTVIASPGPLRHRRSTPVSVPATRRPRGERSPYPPPPAPSRPSSPSSSPSSSSSSSSSDAPEQLSFEDPPPTRAE